MAKKDDEAQVLIHDVMHAVQSSLQIAEDTAREHYEFSVSELEVTASFDFEFQSSQSDQLQQGPPPKRWLALFSRRSGTKGSNTKSSDNETSDKGQLKLRMLFKPGGKLLEGGSDSGQSSGDSE